MHQQKQNILITRPLSGRQREYAHSLGLNPVEKLALEFRYTKNWNYVLKIIDKHAHSDWVFTSQNSVKALEQLMNKGLEIHPEIQIFAVGRKTQQALQNLELDAKCPSRQDGYHLAKFIIEEGKTDSVIHFRSNLSQREMSNILSDNDIEVIKVEVYKTLIHPVKLPAEPVEAILFYSPSAVEGFKQGQGFDQPLPPLFAIGSTTAAALKGETNQPVNISDQSNTKTMLYMVSNRLNREEKHEN